MKGYKTRGNASRDKRGQVVPPPARPAHPDRATRLVGLIAAGALGGLGGGLAVGFATAAGTGLSVTAAHHGIPAATIWGSGAPGSVVLTSAFSEALVAPMPSPSPSPSPTGGNKPAPTKSPSATASPTPGDPNASAPLPTPTPPPTPTPTPTSTKTTSPGKTTGSGRGSGRGSTGNDGSGVGALDLGSPGGGATPLVNVPGISPENPTGLFPTVGPGSGSGSNPGGKGKRIEAVTTAATTPLDSLIPGQVVGLAVLIGAIALAFVRFSLRTSPSSDSKGKSQ